MAQIGLVNNTSENIRVAIFKKSSKTPSLQIVAWRIEALPRSGGNTSIMVPSNYDVYINYSFDPETREYPNSGIKTTPISLDIQTAKFLIREERTNDNNAIIATVQRVSSYIVDKEIYIENQASFGVWGHILLDGQDVYPPQIITPGRTLIKNLTSPFYVAVIDEFIMQGAIIKQEELSSPPLEIAIGDTVLITGSKWQGYSLTKIQ